MKATSIKKLSEVYSRVKEIDPKLSEMIMDVIRVESSIPKKSKLDLYAYTSKDNYRSSFCGVYHADGYRVATDARILVAIKSDYPDEFEGKTILKDGSTCPVPYPNWKSVIPSNTTDYKACPVNVDKFYDWLNGHRAEMKANHGKNIKWGDGSWTVRLGDSYFGAELFYKFLTIIKEFGVTEIMTCGHKPAYVRTEKGVALLMPKFYDENKEYLEL